MNSYMAVGGDGSLASAGASRRVLVVFGVAALAIVAAVVMLVLQVSPADAQISIGSIVCPILRSLAAAFSGFGFLGNLFNSLLSSFGC